MSLKSSIKVIKSVYGSWVKISLPFHLFYLNGMLDRELKYFLKDLNSESQVFTLHYHLLSN